MEKWEEKYNEINPKIDAMISEQTAKINEATRKQAELGKDVNSQEYKQAKVDLKTARAQKENLEKLKPNLKKVSNYLEFKKQLEARLNEYSRVRNNQNEMINNNRQIKKCEQQEKEATEDLKNLTEMMRSGNLSESEKSEVNKKITEAANKKQNAFNLRNQLNGKNNALDEELKEYKYSEVNRDTIKEQMAKLGKTIEIVDQRCEALMDGQYVENIYDQAVVKKVPTEPAANTISTEPIVETEEPVKTVEPEKNNELNEFDELKMPPRQEKDNRVLDDNFEFIGDLDTQKIESTEKGNLIVFKAPFNERHPRLAKIADFFRNLKDKILNRNKTFNLEEELSNENKEEKVDKEIAKIVEQKQLNLTDKEMDRIVEEILNDNEKLEELGTKGTNEFRESLKVAKTTEAKQKLEQNRDINPDKSKERTDGEER